MNIDVLNIKHNTDLSNYDLVLYCGRRSYTHPNVQIHNMKLGNPFTVAQYGKGNALNQFKLWLDTDNSIGYRTKVIRIAQRIKELEKEHNKTYHVALLCWCKPAPCHADVIKQLMCGI